MPAQLPVIPQAEGTASDRWHFKSIKLEGGQMLGHISNFWPVYNKEYNYLAQ